MTLRDDFKDYLKKKRFRVSIFGSARIKKNDPIYKNVKSLAEMLGDRDIDIVTGGGPGLMAAASEGHALGSKENKARAVGLSIVLPREQKTNPWVQVEKRFFRFSNRLDNFMLLSNAIVVAPGGVGTMLEFFYAWQLVQVKGICDIPIILLGGQWEGLTDWLREEPLKHNYFSKKDLDMVFHATTVNEAMEVIDEVYKDYKAHGKNFCLNYRKYKLF